MTFLIAFFLDAALLLPFNIFLIFFLTTATFFFLALTFFEAVFGLFVFVVFFFKEDLADFNAFFTALEPDFFELDLDDFFELDFFELDFDDFFFAANPSPTLDLL